MKYEAEKTSVIKPNLFEKAVRKVICLKSETIFPIRMNVNNFLSIPSSKTTFVKYFFTILYHKLYFLLYFKNKTVRNRWRFIFIKDFLSKMMKKTKSKHFVRFIISKTLKTIKVKKRYKKFSKNCRN